MTVEFPSGEMSRGDLGLFVSEFGNQFRRTYEYLENRIGEGEALYLRSRDPLLNFDFNGLYSERCQVLLIGEPDNLQLWVRSECVRGIVLISSVILEERVAAFRVDIERRDGSLSLFVERDVNGQDASAALLLLETCRGVFDG